MKTTRKTNNADRPNYAEEEDDINAEIKAKHYNEALARISSIEKQRQPSPRVRELKGLALARLGHVAEAHETLGELYKEGHRGAETIGIYARTFMDLYDKSGDRTQLQQSRDLYAEGFE